MLICLVWDWHLGRNLLVENYFYIFLLIGLSHDSAHCYLVISNRLEHLLKVPSLGTWHEKDGSWCVMLFCLWQLLRCYCMKEICLLETMVAPFLPPFCEWKLFLFAHGHILYLCLFWLLVSPIYVCKWSICLRSFG